MDPTTLILGCVLNFQTKSQLNLIQTSLTNVPSECVLFLNKFRQNIVFLPKFVEYGVLPSFKNVLLYEDSLQLSLNSFTCIKNEFTNNIIIGPTSNPLIYLGLLVVLFTRQHTQLL